MIKPRLIVVAGCNGSGKSTFSKTYVKNETPFDFTKGLWKSMMLWMIANCETLSLIT